MVSTAEFVTDHLSELRDLELFDPSTEPPSEVPLSQRRRAGLLEGPGMGQAVLVEEDGVLRWEVGRTPVPTALRGRRGRLFTAPTGKVVLPLRFRELEPSDVWTALERLDRKLSGEPGWLRFEDGKVKPARKFAVTPGQRVLLFVHGTFSKAQAIVDGVNRSSESQAFWTWAKDRYDTILLLNHHTLRPTPVANAMELAALFDDTDVTVHAVGHSRGSLVLRWWLEALDRGRGERRAVLVGGTLGGTSLASPPKLRAAIGLLTNVLRVMHGATKVGSAIVPPLAPLVGLLKVLSFATNGLARTPLVDAGVAIVPGLAAMSRVGNNAELLALRGRVTSVPRGIFAVRSNFEPEDPGWRFWRHFRGPNFADPASDTIFQGDNDLVVDTTSMIDLADHHPLPTERVLDFGTHPEVHHLNYFEQPQTLTKIQQWLGHD